MIKNIIWILTITLFFTLGIFLPHFPGDYDGLAPTLSFMSQLFCFAGLILVPIGTAWLICEIKKYRTKTAKPTPGAYYLAIVALATGCIITTAISVTVYVSNNRSLGVITFLLWLYFVTRLIPGIKKLKNSSVKKFNAIPVYLVCIPLVVLLIRNTLIDHAVTFSKTRAIQKSKELIRDIEIYYTRNGHYPPSMLSVWKDYKTSVTGIKQYHYELNGQSYNLYFEQVSGSPATKEIVMYNPFDEHEMTSHDQDLLLLSANELNRQRGYFAVYSLPHPHWKCFLFD